MCLSKKELDKLIRQEIKEFNSRHRLKGCGDSVEDSIGKIANTLPIGKVIYDPIKSIVDVFSDAASNLLPSARARENGIDIFRDQDFIDPNNEIVKAQGITLTDQAIYRDIVNAGNGGFNKIIKDPNSKYRKYLDKDPGHFPYVYPTIIKLHNH